MKEKEVVSGWWLTFAFVNACASVPFTAFVIFVLWGWFITPHFPNTLNKWQVMGIASLISYVSIHLDVWQKENWPELIGEMLTPWMRGGFALLLGYIYMVLGR